MFDPISNYWVYSAKNTDYDGLNKHKIAFSQAGRLFQEALFKSTISTIWHRLLRQSDHLLDLTTILQNTRLIARYDGGIQAVHVASIIGSEGRTHEYDSSFRPLSPRSRERWSRIAALRFEDEPLPAVELIRVGGRYFVRDGHHRVSVARALHQEMIDAQVTIIEVTGALPWEHTLVEEQPESVLPMA